jgi:hypothetical protein
MFEAGRRLFSVASLALILVAALHTLGHFSPPPPGSALLGLEAEMDGVRLPLGLGMTPSVLDIFSSLSLTMTVTLVALGLQNLVVAKAPEASARLLRALSFVSLAAVGALVALYAFYRIPPPFLTLAIVEVLFLLALVLPPRPS